MSARDGTSSGESCASIGVSVGCSAMWSMLPSRNKLGVADVAHNSAGLRHDATAHDRLHNAAANRQAFVRGPAGLADQIDLADGPCMIGIHHGKIRVTADRDRAFARIEAIEP